VFILNYTPL